MAAMTHQRRVRSGAVMLEALVALLIIATVVTSSLQVMRSARETDERAARKLRDVRAATALLEAAALWTSMDLDRHLGSRRQGPWMMEVSRRNDRLYDLRLEEADGRLLLRTTLYRPVRELLP